MTNQWKEKEQENKKDVSCKNCIRVSSATDAGCIDQWKKVKRKPLTTWYCDVMFEYDYQDSLTGCSPALKDFEPCPLYKEYSSIMLDDMCEGCLEKES